MTDMPPSSPLLTRGSISKSYDGVMVGAKLPEWQRRRLILDAAAQVALADGLENITVRKVAHTAEVSPGLVFHHFESKEGLLVGLLQDLLESTLDAAEIEANTARSGEDRLLALVAEEVQGLQTQSAQVELLFAFYFARRDAVFRDPIRAALHAYAQAFAAAARAAATDTVDADELVHLVVSLIEGAAVLAIVAPDQFRPERLISTLAAVLDKA